MIRAGALGYRVTVQARQTTDDGYGNVESAWADMAGLARVSAFAMAQTGRERLAAGALQSTVPVTLRLRASAAARGIGAGCRVVFATGPHAGRTAAIDAVIPSADGSFIELVAVIGEPT
jgi:head-tail adaptor